MGMDCIGKNQDSEVGKYFRNSVWWWHPLADYCMSVAPGITRHCKHWHSNDGDGLDEMWSLALARVLRTEIAEGRTAKYQDEYTAELNALPDERCKYCDGTGTRGDAIGVSMGMVEKKWCNGCDGKGSHRPFATSYPFSVENVQEFADFLEKCGGFEIW